MTGAVQKESWVIDRWIRAGAVALAVFLAGCATAPERPVADIAPKPRPVLQDEDVDAAPVAPVTAEVAKDEITPGTGELINLAAAKRPNRKPPEQGKASLNFADMPIADVVKMILGDLLGENYVIAAGVSGTVTFSTVRPVTSEQALSILEMLLSWNNLALVYIDGQYSIVPAANAVRGNLTPRVGSLDGARGFEVRAIPLQFIAPTEMEKLLQPYAREGAILKADNARSLIVLAGTRRELENYLTTVEVFDVDWIKGMSIGLITLEEAEAKALVPELDQIFGEASGSPLAGMFRFLPIERLNAILVITPQRRYLNEAERWIERLDKGGNQPGVRLYVYDVKNVKATDLSDRLNDIFGGSGGESNRARTSNAAGSLAPGLQPVELSSGSSARLRGPTGERIEPNKDASNPGGAAATDAGAQQRAFAAASAPGGGGDQGLAIIEGEEIRITAVEENNQLIIRSTPGQYEAIRGAIRKLDTVPLQVHIEARLLDVSLSNSLQFGVSWFFDEAVANLPVDDDDDDDDDDNSAASALKEVLGTATFGQIGGGGNRWIFSGKNAAALITFLQNETDTKVLSAPSVLVLNNTEASINVGQQIPVVSSFFNPITTPGTGGSSVGQSQFQFRDTGITLEVKPRVNPGGLVFMEISAEQSTPGASSAASDFGGNVPVDQQTISTEIAVQSGDTVLLGGLIQQNDSQSNAGVPGLKNIPIIGRLFGSSNTDNSRKELLVLITPTVVRGGEEAAEITDEYKQRFRGLEPLLRDMEEAERARLQRLQNEKGDNDENP